MPAIATNPALVLRDAASGFAQQMVLWGHDVRHPAGNALVRYGLQRAPSPGLTGTSCYSMPWENGRIELHGAVASWTTADDSPGCVFCRDLATILLWNEIRPPVPGAEQGESGPAETRLAAAMPLIRWLIDYETWALENLGESWRHGTWQAIKRLPRGKTWLPPDLALRWWKLAVSGNPPRAKSLKN